MRQRSMLTAACALSRLDADQCAIPVVQPLVDNGDRQRLKGFGEDTHTHRLTALFPGLPG